MSKSRRDDILLNQVTKRLKELRTEKGVSQLRVLIDTQVHVSQIENKSYNLTLSTLSILCKYYGVSLTEFFDSIENEEPDKTPKKK